MTLAPVAAGSNFRSGNPYPPESVKRESLVLMIKRMILMLVIVAAFVGALAAYKTHQVKGAMAQGAAFREEVPPEKLKVAELRSAIAPGNESRGDRRRLPRGIEGSRGEVFEAICWADVLGFAVSGLVWTHVSQGSLVPRAGSQAVFKSRRRSAAYLPTKGRGGGKQPMGKGASRRPARSFSVALR